MNIHEATSAYEAWLARQMPLLPADLKLKHERMAESSFSFLRAAFYRWCQLWPEVCPKADKAPMVLSIGDAHIENFGTWRDVEGRLIWGANDFDEACVLPYSNDLVRLAVSAILAQRESHLSGSEDQVCEAILSGYGKGLRQGGCPFVLAERHGWLRALATGALTEPKGYWDRLNRWKTVETSLPADVKPALVKTLPSRDLKVRVIHRQAGLGSLGRRRFALLAEWQGGFLAREAKELCVSAWNWAHPGQRNSTSLYQAIVDRAVRVPDPCLTLPGKWVIRRLAPDCGRVELAALSNSKDEYRLLEAMGWEIGNIHLGTKSAISKVTKDLKNRPAKWLLKASEAMTEAMMADWQRWRRKG